MRTTSRLALGSTLGVVCLALLAGGILAIAGLLLMREDHRSHVLRGAVERVEVEGDSGNVTLRPGPAGRATVVEDRRYLLSKPDLDLALRDGVLSVRVECGSFGPACSDDLRLTVPAGVGRSVVDVDSGDVHVHGGGALDVRSDSGDVDVANVAGALRLHTDSGDVTARGVRAPTVEADADSGDVDLALLVAPRSVAARTDSGDVDLAVPADRYRVDADADSGDVDLDGVLRDDTAPRTIEVRSDSGNVDVRGR